MKFSLKELYFTMLDRVEGLIKIIKNIMLIKTSLIKLGWRRSG